jgi:DNA polymerase IIIc chi subunit
MESIQHALQPKSDDYQCGIWDHVVLATLLKYLSSADAPSSAGFDAYMAQQPSFRPIISASSLSEQRMATRANVSHAIEVRATLRSALWQAAVEQTLPHGLNAQLEHLGSNAAEGIDLDVEDAMPDDGDDDPDVCFVEADAPEGTPARAPTLGELALRAPDDALVQLLINKQQQAADNEATRADVQTEMAARMDTGVRVNDALRVGCVGDGRGCVC